MAARHKPDDGQKAHPIQKIASEVAKECLFPAKGSPTQIGAGATASLAGRLEDFGGFRLRRCPCAPPGEQ